MQIKIDLFSPTKFDKIYLNTTIKKFTFNDIPCLYNLEFFVTTLLNIISSWPEESTACVFDTENYSIRIKENDQIKSYFGNFNYPQNYNLFKDLLEEAKKCLV